jgi:hypothetical protein
MWEILAAIIAILISVAMILSPFVIFYACCLSPPADEIGRAMFEDTFDMHMEYEIDRFETKYGDKQDAKD